MLTLAPIALIIDYALGYPRWLLDRAGHPVTWIGAWIGYCDRCFNQETLPQTLRRQRGIGLLLSLVLMGGVIGFAIVLLTQLFPMGWMAEAFIAAALLGGRSLYEHVDAVHRALSGEGIEAARSELAKIVGRDVDALDEAGICRAAIESLSENSSDGLVAPVFWYVVAGMPGILIYKAVSTADSMVGYKTPRHLAFGWASAKADDLLNWIPARLTAALYALAAFCYRSSAAQTWRTAWRDARKHPSPNAGWPEAAMAGALDIQLGGAVMRQGHWHEHPTFGQGRRELNTVDIAEALLLYRWLCGLLLTLLLIVAAFWPSPASIQYPGAL